MIILVTLGRTVEYIKRTYWFPNLRDKVKKYIENCLKCLSFSSVPGRTGSESHNIPKGNKPFVTVHIDHYGPLAKTRKSNKYIFEIIDGFSKFVKFYAVKSAKTCNVIHCLVHNFTYYSAPIRIVSDRGTGFTSEGLNDFVKKYGISHVKVAISLPKSNGQIEGINRDLTPMLAKLSCLSDEFEEALSTVEFAINNSFCRSIGTSPSCLLFGIHQNDNSDPLRNLVELLVEDDRNLNERRAVAQVKNREVQEYNKWYYDQKHKPPQL